MGTSRTGTNHADNGITYDQVVYHCSSDDWWVTVESPVESEKEE